MQRKTTCLSLLLLLSSCPHFLQGMDYFQFGQMGYGQPSEHPAAYYIPSAPTAEISQLHQAARSNDLDTVKYYLETAHMTDIPDAQGHNALWYAITNGAVDVARYLANLQDALRVYNLLDLADERSGDTYLHRAPSAPMINLILEIESRFPINARNNVGETALDQAFRNNRSDLVQALINGGARVADENGILPFNAENVIRRIYGANPLLVDILLDRIDDLQVNLAASAPSRLGSLYNFVTSTPSQVNNAVKDLFPLVAAIRQGSPRAVALLIQHGADTALRDTQGGTLEDLAQQHGQDRVNNLLLQVRTARNATERDKILQSFARPEVREPQQHALPDIYQHVQQHNQPGVVLQQPQLPAYGMPFYYDTNYNQHSS